MPLPGVQGDTRGGLVYRGGMANPLAVAAAAASALFFFVAATRRRAAPAGSVAPGLSWQREALLREALALEGTLYQWGGGRSPSDYGVDCSGLVILASKRAGVPLPPCNLATSNGWWQCGERVAVPEPGDLALYGAPDRAIHVELVLSFDGQEAQTLGANGGDRDVLTPAVAQARNANVRHATTAGRSNFLGFVRNPVDDGRSGEAVPRSPALQFDEA